MPAWLIPAISGAASVVTGLMGKKRPRMGALPGAAEDRELAGKFRGMITQGLPGLSSNNAGRYQATLDRDTRSTFDRRSGTETDRMARLGATGGSGAARNRGILTRAESQSYGDNTLTAERLAGATQDRKLGFINSMTSGLSSLQSGARQGAMMEHQDNMAEWQEDQAGNSALSGALAGVAGRSAAGAAAGGDWQSALAAGFAPGYLSYLMAEQDEEGQ